MQHDFENLEERVSNIEKDQIKMSVVLENTNEILHELRREVHDAVKWMVRLVVSGFATGFIAGLVALFWRNFTFHP